MDRRELFDKIGAGQLDRAYLFHGPEQYIKRQALSRLEEKALGDDPFKDFNQTVMEGAGANQIIEAAETLPMMGERRLVVVNDWAPLLPGKARAEQEEADRMTEWLAHSPDTTVIVFFLRKSADSRKASVKRILKQLTAVSFDEPTHQEIVKWIRQRARRQDRQIAPDAVERLIFLAGAGLERLGGEVDKLSAYRSDGGEIIRADVDLLVAPTLESTIFQLIDQLMDKKMDSAFALLDRMLKTGETPVGILAMLQRQMRLLSHIKRMDAQGMRLADVERALKLHHYAATQAVKQMRRFTLSALAELYEKSVLMDYSIKSGRIRDVDALYRLVFEIERNL